MRRTETSRSEAVSCFSRLLPQARHHLRCEHGPLPVETHHGRGLQHLCLAVELHAGMLEDGLGGTDQDEI